MKCENGLDMQSEGCYAGGSDKMPKEFNLSLCKMTFDRIAV
jgi:hypothetical protein